MVKVWRPDCGFALGLRGRYEVRVSAVELLGAGTLKALPVASVWASVEVL